LKGPLSESDFTTIAQALKSTFWDGIDELPSIDVISATIHGVMLSRNPDLAEFRGLVVPSVLYRSAKEYYDRGGRDAWELTRNFVKQLLQLDPDHRPGLVLQAKVQIRLLEWTHAEITIADIKKHGFPEYHYLTGFMYWKKREFAKAVSEFRAALALGQNSTEIYHGLASCLVRLGNLGEADEIVRRGLRGRRPNSMLLDVAAQIAIQ
jgi:tetratricopeptide (TPR) repeat protein